MTTFNPYHQWLGLDPRIVSPNHYQLLFLSHFESRPEVIVYQADQRIASLSAIAAGSYEPLKATIVGQIVEARRCLTDPHSKAAYDQWLQNQLGQPGFSAPMAVPQVPAAVPVGSAVPFAAATATTASQTIHEPGAKSPAVSRRVAKRRRQFPVVVTGILAAGIGAAVLMCILVMAGSDGNERPRSAARVPNAATRRTLPRAKPSPRRVTMRSPQTQQKSSRTPHAEVPDATDRLPETAAAPNPTEPESDSGMPEREAVPEATRSADVARPTQDIPLAATPEDTPPVPVVPSVDDLKALGRLLKRSRAALARFDFVAAQSDLAVARRLPALPEQAAVVDRLARLGQWVREFREALDKAVQGIQPGSSISIPGREAAVGIVDTAQETVVLRVQGMNRTFRLNDLPPGLGTLLADQWLDQTAPTTRIVKGAYVLVNPNSKPTDVDKARAWWQEAVDGGELPADMMAVFDDQYDF